MRNNKVEVTVLRNYTAILVKEKEIRTFHWLNRLWLRDVKMPIEKYQQ
jgi:hypothetical protein